MAIVLQSFGPGIWIGDGPIVAASGGFRYPTRMAVIRLTTGDLFVWSPVSLTNALRSAVDALGPVRHVIAPNALHDRFLAAWREAYPAAQLHAAPGLAERRRDLVFASELSDAPDPAWATDIDQVVVRGNLITTEVVFFHRASGAVLFTDLIQHFDRGWFTSWRAVVARLDLMVAREAQTPWKFRLAFVDRHIARTSITRILAWPAERVLMAHGAPIEGHGRAFLRRAFAWLMR